MRQEKVPHLYNRNGVYYFRYRLSSNARILLNKWELCHSLETSDFDKAALICLRLSSHAKEFDDVMGKLAMKKLTKQKADELVQWYFRDNYEESEMLLGMDMARSDLDLTHELTDVKANNMKLTNEIMSKNFSLVTISDAEELLENNDLELPEKGLLRLRFLEGIARARYELYRIYIATIRGNFHERAIKEPLFAGYNSDQTSDLITPLNSDHDNNKFKVSTLLEKYVSFKSEKVWKKKTIEENARCLNWLNAAIGHKNIKLVSKDEMRDFRDMIEAIPKNYMKEKELNNLTVQEAVKANKNLEVISPETAHKYWGTISAFMKWVTLEYDINVSPITGLKVTVKKNALDKKDPFSHEQLKVWFNSPIYSGCKSPGNRLKPGELIIKDGLYWVPLIGLYTGMRLGEIIQLALTDLCLVDDIWVFDVKADPDDVNKSVKTMSSVRKVPLHKNLIEFGFIQYWDKQKKKNMKRIFEEIKPSTKGYYSDLFSKKFRYRMEKLGIKTDKTSFHSLRHNVKNAFKDKDILDTHQDAILGHAQSGMNAVYGSNQIKKLKECIDLVEYDLKLDHLIVS